MANYCDYEIHVKGPKKAALFMYDMMPALDYKSITHEAGTDEEYIVWMKGNCKWSLDANCEEKKNVMVDITKYSEKNIRNEEIGLNYWYLTMRQKSEILGLEVHAHSWSEESKFDQFDVYDHGNHTRSEKANATDVPDFEDVELFMSYQEYCEDFHVDPNTAPPAVWNKEEYPTYEEFCEEFGIDPQKLPESQWEEDDENEYFCNIPDQIHESSFAFEF